MLKRAIWLAAILLVGAWTLLCLAADGLLGWLGGVGTANADWLTGHPETVALIAWAIGLLDSFGTVVVVAVWAIGAALLLGGAALLARFAARGHGQRLG